MTAIIITAAVILLLFILLASSLTVYLDYGEGFKVKIKYLFFTILMNPDSPRRIKKREKKKAKEKKKAEKERIKQEKKEAKDKIKTEKKRKKQEKRKPESKERHSEPAPYKRLDNSQSFKAENNPSPSENEPTNIHGSDKKENRKKDKDKKEDGKKDKDKKEKKKVDLGLIIRLIKRASPHVKRIFKKIRFYDVDIRITVGGEDAAKAAVSYGAHCSIINSLIAFLDSTVTFKAKRIDIKADFDLEKSQYYAKGTVKLRMSTLLHSAIWGACAVLSEISKAKREAESAKPQLGHSGKTKKAA